MVTRYSHKLSVRAVSDSPSSTCCAKDQRSSRFYADSIRTSNNSGISLNAADASAMMEVEDKLGGRSTALNVSSAEPLHLVQKL